MPDETACERRIYRLAVLLTGNPTAAADVITSVLRSQPNLRQMDSAHMDRLTILRSRDVASQTLPSPPLKSNAARAIGSLVPQQREAWVLRVVYRMPLRQVARAMDCSVSATERHLHKARTRLRSIEDETGLRDDLLTYSLSLDVPEFYRSQKRRRRRWRMIRRILLVILVIAALSGIVFIMLRFTIWSDVSSG